MENYFRVGIIANTHALKGELKIKPTTEDINRFDYLKEAYIDFKGEYIHVNVEKARYFKGMVILKFKEYNNINDVEKYKSCDLLVDRKNAIPLEDGLYYVQDLIGCRIITDEGKDIGVLKDVMETGANDVYVVELDNGGEVLLPVIDQCILNKDIEKREILVHMMKGLMD